MSIFPVGAKYTHTDRSGQNLQTEYEKKYENPF
jgi:hypothetical protein